ncbi:helix-turn-helix transcriptional regulator [Actinoplanes sp. NPDC023714]|uniref:helix-turn-helix domain-containing protein n=1 Tax=Actinoplanes sp. NPDC023714 TaxID=3154322 RepID=UPI0033D64F71
MSGRTPSALGEIIRRQRELAELPMRQLASMVGISIPYLSQIERGLRAPSEKVLHAIAGSLRTTADALMAEAGPEQGGAPTVLQAIAADPDLTARQRQALAEVYASMTEVTIARRHRERPGV